MFSESKEEIINLEDSPIHHNESPAMREFKIKSYQEIIVSDIPEDQS